MDGMGELDWRANREGSLGRGREVTHELLATIPLSLEKCGARNFASRFLFLPGIQKLFWRNPGRLGIEYAPILGGTESWNRSKGASLDIRSSRPRKCWKRVPEPA